MNYKSLTLYRIVLLWAMITLLSAGQIQASPPMLTVTTGLKLWLAADDGVSTNASGEVDFWGDLSGLDNSALPVGVGVAPVVVPDSVNGLPAVRFDGVDDYLEIANSLNLQPGSGDWTVLFVAKRLGGSVGDFPQVIGSRPWTAALDKGWAVAFGGDGRVGSHYADGVAGHDVPAILSVNALSTSGYEIWQVEEDRAGGVTRFFRNGDNDSVVVSPMPTAPIDQLESIYIGREIGGADNRRANIEIAEILIYCRVLDEAERNSVSSYLGDKYGMPFVPNMEPSVSLSSPMDGLSVVAPADLTLTATATDVDGTIARVEFYNGGTRLAVATAPPFEFPIRVTTPGGLELTAVAVDDRGGRATSASVTVTVTGAGSPTLDVTTNLKLWLKADEGVSTNLDGTVSFWADLSGLDNSAVQSVGVESPLHVVGAANGLPVVRFDGVDDYLEIANAASLQPGLGDWTVFFVGKRAGASQGDFPQVIGSRPWVAGLDKGWAVSFGGAVPTLGSHYADGGSGHDVPAVRSASVLSDVDYQIWQVEENRTAGTTGFYLNGAVDSVLPRPMPAGAIDQGDSVYLGREIGGANNRRANLDLAEVIIYCEALGGADRESVTAYLSAKYGQTVIQSRNHGPLVVITSPSEGASISVPATVSLAAEASDADGVVVAVEFFRGAVSLGVVREAPYEVMVEREFGGTATYSARATDNLGAVTDSAGVSVTYVAADMIVPGTIDVMGGLISELDFWDTFTTNDLFRIHNVFPHAAEAFVLESDPLLSFDPINNFSFNGGEATTCCGYAGNTGNDGAATGLAQSGGGDPGVVYGLRDSFVVKVDAIVPGDRLNIGSRPTAAGGIFEANSLTVFFRREGGANPSIGIFTPGIGERSAGVGSGVTDFEWHNYAVHFDKANNYLGLYVDGVLKANLDLTTFEGGAYLNYSSDAVGFGGAGGVFWVDNFMVGKPNRLVRDVHYSDTFTVGVGGRNDGIFNDNSGGAYNVESNPTLTWLPNNGFSFNTGETSTCCGYPGNAGNDGAASGLAQSGGGDFSFEYGEEGSYVVELSGTLPGDRLDISSLPSAGGGIFSMPSLSVFLRKDSAGTIGLFNGAVETSTGMTTGVDDTGWHKFAVHFGRSDGTLGVYVDGVLVVNLDLTTFAGGIYENYSNGAVGVGGAGGVIWVDNFQVGVPECDLPIELPGSLAISVQGTDAVVEWDGSGTLQEGESVLGPWTDLPSAVSPHVVPIVSGAIRVYRLVLP